MGYEISKFKVFYFIAIYRGIELLPLCLIIFRNVLWVFYFYLRPSLALSFFSKLYFPHLFRFYISLHLSFSYYVPFPYGNLARYLLTICRVYAIIMPLLLFNRLSHKSILFLVPLLYAKNFLCRSIFCFQFKIIKHE